MLKGLNTNFYMLNLGREFIMHILHVRLNGGWQKSFKNPSVHSTIFSSNCDITWKRFGIENKL